MMKRKPSDLPKMSKPKSVKKTIVINCFTGEEREVDRRKIKIVDGMEIGNTRVELDNGVKLAVAGEGKYHTLGNPKERWAEVAEVLVLPDGEYGDGDGLRCFLPVVKRSAPKRQCPKAAKEKKGRPQRLQRKRNQCSQQSVPLCKAVPQYQKTPTKKAILPRQQRIHLAQPASCRRDPKSQRPFESINCLTRFSGF